MLYCEPGVQLVRAATVNRLLVGGTLVAFGGADGYAVLQNDIQARKEAVREVILGEGKLPPPPIELKAAQETRQRWAENPQDTPLQSDSRGVERIEAQLDTYNQAFKKRYDQKRGKFDYLRFISDLGVAALGGLMILKRRKEDSVRADTPAQIEQSQTPLQQ
jgi:hypothetical protein